MIHNNKPKYKWMGMTVNDAMFYCVLLLCILIAFCLIHRYTARYIKKPTDFRNNSLNTLEQHNSKD